MNQHELEEYKEKLDELREAHLKEKEATEEGYLHNSQKESSGDLSAYSIHMADISADSYERDKNAGLAANINNILYEIDDALYRIQKGDYGLCEDCQKPIVSERLQAVPYARTCIECQKIKEKNKKQ
ncbi:MAG: TraR/DksA C4-type zinc finger protein [Nitrospirota bacterium]